jgi:hypothetical protein
MHPGVIVGSKTTTPHIRGKVQNWLKRKNILHDMRPPSPVSVPTGAAAWRGRARMVLLAQYQNVATKVGRMDLADIVVCPSLGRGELDGHLGFWLDHLLNAKGFDLKAMRVI